MAGDPLDDALDERIAELQARDSSQGTPDAGAASTPPQAPPAPTSTTPATTALPDKEAATMAELEEVLQRLLQPVHDKIDQLGADLASRLAATEDACTDGLAQVNSALAGLRSHVTAVAAAAGASPAPDPEMVDKAKEHLEQDWVKDFDVPDQIRIVAGLLKKDFPGRSDDEINAAITKAGEELD